MIFNLKQVRQNKGLTIRDLASMSKISTATIVDLEKTGRRPAPVTLDKLVIALDIEPQQLFVEDFVILRDAKTALGIAGLRCKQGRPDLLYPGKGDTSEGHIDRWKRLREWLRTSEYGFELVVEHTLDYLQEAIDWALEGDTTPNDELGNEWMKFATEELGPFIDSETAYLIRK